MMKRGKLAGTAGAFLFLMLLFTVLSRAADSAGIANVTLGRPQSMMIAHEVRGTGRVEQNQEQAVITEAGQRVGTVFVNEGQQVEKGEPLFELDMDSLEENILTKKQEIQKLKLQLEETVSQEAVNEERRANSQAQAAENSSLSSSRAAVSLSHAKENLEKAKRELKDYREKEGISGEDTLAEQELEQICEERSAAYVQAQQELRTLQWRIEKAVDDALRQAGKDSAAEKAPNPQVKTGSAGAAEEELKEPEPFEIISEEEPGVSVLGSAEPADPAEQPEISEGGGDIWIDNIIIEEADPENGGTGGSFAGNGEADGTIVEEDPGYGGQTGNGGTGGVTGNDAASSLGQQDPDEIEQDVRDRYAAELETAQEAVSTALAKKQEAEAALEDCRQKMLAARGSQNAEQEQQLIDAVKAAQMSYEDAALAANEAAVTGRHEMELAGLPEARSSTADIYRMDLKQNKRELSKLKKLKKEKGKIKAPVDGIVTEIHVTAGERTPDGTAVMLADLTKGCSLTAEIPQEQEKYIGRGDLAEIKSGDGKITLKEIPVESVRTKTDDETVRLVTVQIPENKLQIGTAAELSLTKKTAAYPLCIPVAALYLDEKNQTYVLAVQEVNSVLGTEMQALKVPVTVEERNDSYAALTQGSISSSQEIIVSSDRAVSEGSRVRVVN